MNEKIMKTALLRQFHQPLCLEEVPIPEPGPGEILAKVLASGLCASDLHIIDGMIPTVSLPYTPGHEICGEIVKAGSQVKNLSPGDRFVAGIDIVCGECEYCARGRENLCRERIRIGFERNGGHGQYCILPEEVIFKISRKIPCEEAAVIPDAVACMYHALKQAQVRQGDVICILGTGGLGIQGIQLAKLMGTTIIATSRNDEKLRIAKEFGADYVINTKKEDLQREVERITGGKLCQAVFDNIGISSSVSESLKILK